MILAGDVGGTKTRLAVFDSAQTGLRPIVEETYASRDHTGLEEIVDAFVTAHRLRVRSACFGVAGPVRDGVSSTPNLAWTVEARRLAVAAGVTHAVLINDLEANAHGIAALGPEDFAVLNEGDCGATGNAAVVSAGTGLGEAILFWDGRAHRPFASEGGHADFAPRDALECALLEYLREIYGRVSYERVHSGPGLWNVYRFLRDTGRGTEPAWLAADLERGDPSAVVANAALEERSTLCVAALELFCSLYGSEAGNLALKALATGGVYLGGGIAPKILPALRRPAFLDAFVEKGRMRPLLEGVPVRVILNDRAALFDAARRAAAD